MGTATSEREQIEGVLTAFEDRDAATTSEFWAEDGMFIDPQDPWLRPRSRLINQRVVFASMAGTRFTPELNLDGLSPDEAFAVLGNEIRLDIIRVLWHADAAHEYDDVTDTVKTISFSKLHRRATARG